MQDLKIFYQEFLHMLNEPTSPNIRYHDPRAFIHDSNGPIIHSEAEIYKNGVIVIDTNLSLFYNIYNAFQKYEKKGFAYDVNFNGREAKDQPVGSKRVCMNSDSLAKLLTEVVKNLGLVDIINDTPTSVSKFIQVSKYFRLMKYERYGEHAPHYDSDFKLGYDYYFTGYSLVLYLTNNKTGELAFCNDSRGETTDWTRQAHDDEIYLKVSPKEGRIVLFPHTLCHSVLPFNEDSVRMVVRGDLIFQGL